MLKVQVVEFNLKAYNKLEQYLLEYNQTHKDYLLIIPEDVTYGRKRLWFDYFSNAWAIIEIGYDKMWHQSPAESHYTGLLDATNIMFGIANSKGIYHNFSQFNSIETDFGFIVIDEYKENNFTLVQDSKKNIWKLFLRS